MSDLQGDELLRGDIRLAGLPAPHVDDVLLQRMEQKGPKTAFGRVGSLDQMATEHDLVEEPLRQVLGLLVVAACTPEVAVNGPLVSLQEQSDHRPLGLLLPLDALDQRPVGRQEGLCRPAHVRLIAKSHSIYSPTHGTTLSTGSLYR